MKVYEKSAAVQKETSAPASMGVSRANIPNSAILASLNLLPSRETDLSSVMNARMEARFGVPLSGLRVFKDDGIKDTGMYGYARGNEVHVSDDLSGAEYERALSHEIGHVVQQGSGMVRGSGFIRDTGLESQADAGLRASPNAFSMPESAVGAPVQGGWFSDWKDKRAQKKKEKKQQQEQQQRQEQQRMLIMQLKRQRKEQRLKEQQEKTEHPKEAEDLAKKQEDEDLVKAHKLAAEITGKTAPDFSGMNAKTMLRNMEAIKLVKNDFTGLNVSKIEGAVKIEGTNASANRLGEISFNNISKSPFHKDSPSEDDFEDLDNLNKKDTVGNYKFHSGSKNFTGAHEAGHVVNAELIKKVYGGSEDQQEEDWHYDLLANQIMQDAALKAAQHDPGFRKKLAEKADLQGIDEADRNSGNEKYMKKLKEAATVENMKKMGYTSGYGGSSAGELYAEAFRDYYMTKDTREKQLGLGFTIPKRMNPLSEHIVQISQKLYRADEKTKEGTETLKNFRDNHQVWRDKRQKEIAEEKAKAEAEAKAKAQAKTKAKVN